MSSTLLLFDDRMIDHDPGRGHPERPERLQAIVQQLRERPVPGTQWATPSRGSAEAVARVHSREHVALVEAARGTTHAFDPDTLTSPQSVEAAMVAVGAAIDGVDAVLDGRARNAFALTRPPGHHAEPQGVMGFCLLNQVAIAAEHALLRPEVERVLVVDWDVHHGNGTQRAFYERRDVMFASTHQAPYYPGTGALAEHGQGEGEGFTLNVPLEATATDADLRRVMTDVVAPAAEQFDPDLVLVSAGFDAHAGDPLGGMVLSTEGFADLCGTVRAIAEARAKGRLVLVLEGGYDLEALAASVYACVEVLAGATAPGGSDQPSAVGDRALREAVAEHRRYWPV